MASFSTNRDEIGYEIRAEGYHEHYGADGGQEITEVCYVNWNQRDAFIRAILPDVTVGEDNANLAFQISAWDGSFIWNDANGNPSQRRVVVNRRGMYRKLPQRHRNYRHLYAVGAEVMGGIGYPSVSNTRLQFYRGKQPGVDGKAVVAVTYRPLTYVANVEDQFTNEEVSDGATTAPESELARYVTREVSMASKAMVMQGTAFGLYDDAGSRTSQCPDNFAKPFVELHLTYTWHMVPHVPYAARYLVGMVNGTRFDFHSDVIRTPNGMQVGLILYLDYEVSKRYYTCTGTEVRDITYHFLGRIHRNYLREARVPTGFARVQSIAPLPATCGHNHFWLPSANAFLMGFRPQPIPGMPAGNNRTPQLTNNRSSATPNYPGTQVHDYGNLHALFRLDGTMTSNGGETP